MRIALNSFYVDYPTDCLGHTLDFDFLMLRPFSGSSCPSDWLLFAYVLIIQRIIYAQTMLLAHCW